MRYFRKRVCGRTYVQRALDHETSGPYGERIVEMTPEEWKEADREVREENAEADRKLRRSCGFCGRPRHRCQACVHSD